MHAASVSAASARRCLRFGRETVREVHPVDGATNQLEYCMVPKNERREGCFVSSSYLLVTIGAKRRAKLSEGRGSEERMS
jgi:hypothetical protein